MEERNNTTLICSKCLWALALASSLEKIFDYTGPVCSVFISFTSTVLVLNCHCPKAHEIEMNCSLRRSLTVKYLGSVSPIILMCVFDSAGGTPGVSAASLLLTAFRMLCCWWFSPPWVYGYAWSGLLHIRQDTHRTWKSRAVCRIHTRVCLRV